MKRFQIHTVIENQSRYSIDTVWENAQDLEHVIRLHPNTNHSFRLLGHYRSKESPFEYDFLVYQAVRKAGPLRFNAFGFRKILSQYHLHQYEIIPRLGIVSLLNSLLSPSKQPGFSTRMVDEVVMEAPFWLRPLRNRMIRELQVHANIQCAEDEGFRARRELLAEKKIHRPFRIFSLPEMERLAKSFQLNLNTLTNPGHSSSQDVAQLIDLELPHPEKT